MMDGGDANEERILEFAPESQVIAGDTVDLEKIDGSVGIVTDPSDSLVQWGLKWREISDAMGDLLGPRDANAQDSSIWTEAQSFRVIGNIATGLAVIDTMLHLEEDLKGKADSASKPEDQPNSTIFGLYLWFRSNTQYTLQWDMKASARKRIKWTQWAEPASDWSGYETEETAMYEEHIDESSY